MEKNESQEATTATQLTNNQKHKDSNSLLETKDDQVFMWLLCFGTISFQEAKDELHIINLHSNIRTLKKSGVAIAKVSPTVYRLLTSKSKNAIIPVHYPLTLNDMTNGQAL